MVANQLILSSLPEFVTAVCRVNSYCPFHCHFTYVPAAVCSIIFLLNFDLVKFFAGFYGSDHCPVSLELSETDTHLDQC